MYKSIGDYLHRLIHSIIYVYVLSSQITEKNIHNTNRFHACSIIVGLFFLCQYESEIVFMIICLAVCRKWSAKFSKPQPNNWSICRSVCVAAKQQHLPLTLGVTEKLPFKLTNKKEYVVTKLPFFSVPDSDNKDIATTHIPSILNTLLFRIFFFFWAHKIFCFSNERHNEKQLQ